MAIYAIIIIRIFINQLDTFTFNHLNNHRTQKQNFFKNVIIMDMYLEFMRYIVREESNLFEQQ